MILIDNFQEAVLGTCIISDNNYTVYSFDKVLDILMSNAFSLNYEEALDFFYFNIQPTAGCLLVYK